MFYTILDLLQSLLSGYRRIITIWKTKKKLKRMKEISARKEKCFSKSMHNVKRHSHSSSLNSS